MEKELLKKLKEAREIIMTTGLKKSGHNEYSNFDYYTPEQVEALVNDACEKTGTIVLCNLKADEFGLFQTLDFVDIETGLKISFEMRTKHGSITATNESQQMGGTDTYSERYIKMKVFQIKDNNLDFDSHDNIKKVETKVNQPAKQVLFAKLKKDGITGTEDWEVIKNKIEVHTGILVKSKEEMTEEKCRALVDNWNF